MRSNVDALSKSLDSYVSVVIPAYNRREILVEIIKAFAEQTLSPNFYEIIVVDDGSSDDTRAYVEKLLEVVPALTYIRYEENKGPATARNTGIKAARGGIVLLNDNDVKPDRNYVEAHLQYHQRYGDEHIAVVGNLAFAPECIEGSNFGRHCQSRYLGHRSRWSKEALDYANLPPMFFGGGITSVRRTDLLAVGLFDCSFRYARGEDEYMGYLLWKLGVRIIFGEAARALHYDTTSISRYKLKSIEVSRVGQEVLGAYEVILDKAPEYFELTKLRFVLPIDRQKDSYARIIIKLGIRIALNPVVVFLLERWTIITDHYPWLYCGPLYRALIAGWHLQGQRSEQQRGRLVTYGEGE